MTPTKALYIITVLHRFYMFRRHLRRRQRALCQDFKLIKVWYLSKICHSWPESGDRDCLAGFCYRVCYGHNGYAETSIRFSPV